MDLSKMMDGTICRFRNFDQEGYDLMGLICGSEGLLVVVTEVTVKILKTPEVVRCFDRFSIYCWRCSFRNYFKFHLEF